jgi:hypothetical protein
MEFRTKFKYGSPKGGGGCKIGKCNTILKGITRSVSVFTLCAADRLLTAVKPHHPDYQFSGNSDKIANVRDLSIMEKNQ